MTWLFKMRRMDIVLIGGEGINIPAQEKNHANEQCKGNLEKA